MALWLIEYTKYKESIKGNINKYLNDMEPIKYNDIQTLIFIGGNYVDYREPEIIK